MQELKRAGWKEGEGAVGRLTGLFSTANVRSVKSITEGTDGSSSTLQPLFYGVDTNTAAVFSSVRALTPAQGVAHKQAYAWARISAHLHINVRLCLCASSHLLVPTWL